MFVKIRGREGEGGEVGKVRGREREKGGKERWGGWILNELPRHWDTGLKEV